MPTAAHTSLFTRLGLHRVRGRRLPEPADMGTAFGMEQWLDERDHGGLPADARPLRRAWLPRWLQRPAAR